MSDTHKELSYRIAHGFLRVLIRPPTPEETARLAQLYESLSHDFASDPDAATELLNSAGRTSGDAAFIAVAKILLNLDEALMK